MKARLLLIACAGAAVAFAAAPMARQQQATPVFRTASDLVTVDVSVRATGTPVGGLRAADFVLLDNGVPQKIESIESEAVPADITILVETSEAMQDYIGPINNQLQKILAMVRPDDRLRVLAIDTYVTELLPLQRAGDRPPIGKLAVGGLASAHDALAAALLQSAEPNRRHLIIAISDTIDAISTLSAETVRDIARESSASLHIAWVTLSADPPDPERPPPPYLSSQEVLARFRCANLLRCEQQQRFWRPYDQPAPARMLQDFAVLREAAAATGGKAHLPGIFTDRTAAAIFNKVYEDYRHSYILRYAPQGVKREGWHEISVTVPRYPSYEINARRGYSIDTPPPAATGANPAPPARDYDTVAGSFRRMPDLAKAIKAFRAGGNPWPADPRFEAVLALDLADAAFASGRDDARMAAAEMLLAEQRLVRRPIEPDEFERLWLWTALASIEGAIRPALAGPLLAAALARLPDESRLVLGRAILSDQRFPMGMLDAVAAAAAAPIAETAGYYDAAIGHADTAAEARIRKAWFLHRIGRHAEALLLLDAALPRPTDSLLIYWRDLFRGQVLDALGRLDDAIVSYRAARATFPKAQSANVALMNALVRTGGRDEAKALAEAIQTARGSDEDPHWLYWYGDFRIHTAAMARLREMIQVPREPR